MNVKRTLLTRFSCVVLVCVLVFQNTFAQVISHREIHSADTLAMLKDLHPKWYRTNVMNSVYMAAPLIGASFALRSANQEFRSMSVHINQIDKTQWEDYVQYTPLAACYIMKVAGVKGRTSWGRMIVSHAFAAGAMAGFVNGIKYSVKELRPDESTKNSFPSGHTATAFMAATLLHREYGHVSPWISIGAYTVATATGVGRIIHNRHWASDVLCGAGIGIVTGELGYFIGDLIFKDKYINVYPKRENFGRFHNPSNLSLKVGVSIPMSDCVLYSFDEQLAIKQNIHFLAGSDASIDGAYFFNPYIGLGGSFHVMSNNLALRAEFAGDSPFVPVLKALMPGKLVTSNCNLTAYTSQVNVHGSYPFSQMFRLDAKIGGGYAYADVHHDPYRKSILGNALNDYKYGEHSEEIDDMVRLLKENIPERSLEMDIDEAKDSHSFVLSSGLSFHATPSRTMDASVYVDWNMMTKTPLVGVKKSFHTLSTGLSCAMRF